MFLSITFICFAINSFTVFIAFSVFLYLGTFLDFSLRGITYSLSSFSTFSVFLAILFFISFWEPFSKVHFGNLFLKDLFSKGSYLTHMGLSLCPLFNM